MACAISGCILFLFLFFFVVVIIFFLYWVEHENISMETHRSTSTLLQSHMFWSSLPPATSTEWRKRTLKTLFFVSMFYLPEQPSDKQETQSKSTSLKINQGFLRRHSLVAQPGSFRHNLFPVTPLPLRRDLWEMLRQRI